MQQMMDIPAAMPANTDEADSKWHSNRTVPGGEKTLVAIECWVNKKSTHAAGLTTCRHGPYSTPASHESRLKMNAPSKALMEKRLPQ
jgi:hypothetical protein